MRRLNFRWGGNELVAPWLDYYFDDFDNPDPWLDAWTRIVRTTGMIEAFSCDSGDRGGTWHES